MLATKTSLTNQQWSPTITSYTSIEDVLFDLNNIAKTDRDSFLGRQVVAHHYKSELLPDLVKAADVIKQAISSDQRIAIHGDYDVDGTTATSILYLTLKKLGAKQIDFYIPSRHTEGYGLRSKFIETCLANGTQLLLTVDCGTANHQEIAYAKEHGLATIIFDHHSIQEPRPPALAFVNPCLADSPYPQSNLASCGIVYKLSTYLLGRGALDFLPLAALGTVADCCDLTHENRELVYQGLANFHQTKNLGLQALLTVAGITKERAVSTRTIGFQIAPLINAAGRMDSATIIVDLLTTTDPSQAQLLAQTLKDLNNQRRQISAKHLAEAVAMLSNNSHNIMVAYSPDWHIGIIGLIASGIVNKFQKPAIIITKVKEKLTGSCRSLGGINITKLLATQKDLLLEYGGHAEAAGLSLLPEHLVQLTTNLEELSQNFQLDCRKKISLIIKQQDLTMSTARLISQFAPFGYGNKEPILLVPDLTIHNIKPVGQGDKHLKLYLKHNYGFISAIAFNMGSQLPHLPVGRKVDIVAKLEINEWLDRQSLQLNVIDILLS